MQLTCCVDGLSKVTAVAGIDITDLLPSGCTAPVCNNTLGGVAALIIAMPLAIVMSLLLALVAVL